MITLPVNRNSIAAIVMLALPALLTSCSNKIQHVTCYAYAKDPNAFTIAPGQNVYSNRNVVGHIRDLSMGTDKDGVVALKIAISIKDTESYNRIAIPFLCINLDASTNQSIFEILPKDLAHQSQSRIVFELHKQ